MRTAKEVLVLQKEMRAIEHELGDARAKVALLEAEYRRRRAAWLRARFELTGEASAP